MENDKIHKYISIEYSEKTHSIQEQTGNVLIINIKQ